MADYNVGLAIAILRKEPNNARIPSEFWNQLAAHLSDHRHYWFCSFLDKDSDLPYEEVYFKAMDAVRDWHKQHPKS